MDTAVSQKVAEISDQLDEVTKKSLMEGLAESLENMLAQNEQFSSDLKNALDQNSEEKEQSNDKTSAEEKAKEEAMKEALKKMLDEKKLPNLSPEMLQKLCESMKRCQGNAERMCENLQNAGFPMDSEMMKKLAEARQVDKEEAQRTLSELWANMDCQGQCPGEGGPMRSDISPRFSQKRDWTTDPNAPPDDTRFQKEPDTEGAEFKAKFLPPSDLQAFRNSEKIGASISAPDFDPNDVKYDHGGALQQTEGGRASAQGQTIYPQHRGPVGRFFGRE